MARNSKRVANRITVNNTVAASLRVHGAEVAPELQTVLWSGGRAPKLDVALLLSQLTALLDRAAAELADADLAHAAELADDAEPRQARDEALLAVREKLLSLRELVVGAYGETVAGSLQLSEALPEQAMRLLQRVRAVSQALRDKPPTKPAKHKSLKLDFDSLADELDALQQPLDTALLDVDREEREAQASLLRKDRATAEWERIYDGVTHIAYGAYVLSGRPDLAERIEPTTRKRSGVDPDAPAKDPAKDPTNDGPAPAPRPGPGA